MGYTSRNILSLFSPRLLLDLIDDLIAVFFLPDGLLSFLSDGFRRIQNRMNMHTQEQKHTRTHAHTRARAHTRTHAHTLTVTHSIHHIIDRSHFSDALEV